MSTGTVIDLLGGVRATVFAACAAVLLVTTASAGGCAYVRGNTIDTLQAQARTWHETQNTNLDTIAALKTRIDDLVRAWTWDQGQAQVAADRAAQANAKTAAALVAKQGELEYVYAHYPKARAWGAAAVDPAIAGKLPGSAGQN